MSMKLKFVTPFLIFLLLAFFFFLGLFSNPSHLPSALLNKPFPRFELSDLIEPKKKINQQLFLGEVSMLNVWASWCTSCRVEHEDLQKIFNQYSHEIKIYGLNYKDKHTDAIKWLSQFGNPYSQVIEDPEGLLGMDLGISGTPETFIIDRKGIIRYKYVGPVTIQIWQDVLYPKIRKLL